MIILGGACIIESYSHGVKFRLKRSFFFRSRLRQGSVCTSFLSTISFRSAACHTREV